MLLSDRINCKYYKEIIDRNYKKRKKAGLAHGLKFSSCKVFMLYLLYIISIVLGSRSPFQELNLVPKYESGDSSKFVVKCTMQRVEMSFCRFEIISKVMLLFENHPT